jgi:hypothetical protein
VRLIWVECRVFVTTVTTASSGGREFTSKEAPLLIAHYPAELLPVVCPDTGMKKGRSLLYNYII